MERKETLAGEIATVIWLLPLIPVIAVIVLYATARDMIRSAYYWVRWQLAR
jgi:hypothetical protein